MRIDTDAGIRDVTFAPTDDPATITASVAMGEVTSIAAPASWPALGVDPMRPVAHLALGNPHAVLLTDDLRAVDIGVLGARVPDVNLEVIEVGPEPDAVTMRVHERGAGVTEACGTGACAAAFAARAWGLYGGEAITVHMDGGDARVEFGPGNEVTLVGPATFVATIEIEI
jgi:diaminopimelate epimerase